MYSIIRREQMMKARRSEEGKKEAYDAQKVSPVRPTPPILIQLETAAPFREFHLNNSIVLARAVAASSGPSPRSATRLVTFLSASNLIGPSAGEGHVAGCLLPSKRFRSSMNNTVSPRTATLLFRSILCSLSCPVLAVPSRKGVA